MKRFDFCVYGEKFPSDWDDFVQNHPYGSVHQTSWWAHFQSLIPGRGPVWGMAVREKTSQKILGVCLAVRMETGFLKTFWWYSPRGPVCDPLSSKPVGEFLFSSARDFLADKGGLFWRYDPYFSPGWEKDFDFSDRKATQNYQPTDTLEIDLRKSPEEILKEMKRKGRYNINLAQKKGLQLVVKKSGEVTSQDIDDFWDLNHQTTSRDKFSGHSQDYYRLFLAHLPFAVLFFIQTPDGKRIATAISTFYGGKAIYYFGASTSDPAYRNLMAPYLLQWEMMNYAREKGCETYDFLGIAPENQPDHPYAGISEFKAKFGGERRVYGPGREKVFSPKGYFFYRMAKKIRS